MSTGTDSGVKVEIHAPDRADEIRDAALTLFAELGYRATTMRAIGQRIGLRGPSLYAHVVSKHDLLVEIMVRTMDDLLAGYRAMSRESDDVVDQLRLVTEAHVRYHARHQREAFVGNREVRSLEPHAQKVVVGKRDEYQREFVALIQRGARQDRFRVQTPKMAAFAVLGMGIEVASWFRDSGPIREDAIVRQYGEFALRLVAAQ